MQLAAMVRHDAFGLAGGAGSVVDIGDGAGRDRQPEIAVGEIVLERVEIDHDNIAAGKLTRAAIVFAVGDDRARARVFNQPGGPRLR